MLPYGCAQSELQPISNELGSKRGHEFNQQLTERSLDSLLYSRMLLYQSDDVVTELFKFMRPDAFAHQ